MEKTIDEQFDEGIRCKVCNAKFHFTEHRKVAIKQFLNDKLREFSEEMIGEERGGAFNWDDVAHQKGYNQKRNEIIEISKKWGIKQL